MRRTILTLLVTVLAVAGLAGVALATGGGSSVTRGRLERSLPVTFANVYTQEARLLGHRGVTPASLHARAFCDDGAQDQGPGSTWVCLMSWKDPSTPMPSVGYGKFELTVHSNDCYTAGGPSSLVGFQTLTDTAGQTVTNPSYEFDGCFDPHSDGAPTGVEFESSFQITNTALDLDAQRRGRLDVTCGTGDHGCAGTLTVSAHGVPFGSTRYDLAENASTTIALPSPVPAGDAKVTVGITMTHGVGGSSSDLDVQAP